MKKKTIVELEAEGKQILQTITTLQDTVRDFDKHAKFLKSQWGNNLYEMGKRERLVIKLHTPKVNGDGTITNRDAVTDIDLVIPDNKTARRLASDLIEWANRDLD